MADFYCDVSAIGNEYQAYADIPTTWGVPQDGNGKAGPGHTAAVAISTIDCASASASGAGILGVLGVTVSSTLTGAGVTLATNIVTAINASATATGSSYSALLLPLNKLVYARVNPGLTTQVQIMLRIAGTDWNGVVCTTAGTWGTVPTMGAFAGGLDGPFAYIISATGLAIFGKAEFLYGCYVASSAGVASPTTIDDTIHCRTKRSGVNLALSCMATGTATFSVPAGTSRSFLFDDGTLWTGDAGELQLTLGTSGTTSMLTFATATVGKEVILAGRTKYSLNLIINLNAVSASYLATLSAGLTKHTNIRITAANNKTRVAFTNSTNQYQTYTAHGCELNYQTNQTLSLAPLASSTRHELVDCDVKWVIGGDLPALLSLAAVSYPAYVHLDSCRFAVDGGASNISSLVATPANLTLYQRAIVAIENCTGIPNFAVGMPQGVLNYSSQYYWGSADQGRSFRYEQSQFSLDWDAAGVFPTYSAITPEGLPFGVRLQWGALRFTKAITPCFAKIVTMNPISGATTLRVEFLVPTAEQPDRSQLFATLRYTDTGGAIRYMTSLISEKSAVPLDAGIGTGAWVLNGISGVTSKRLSFVTDYPVKINTRVECSLYLGAPPTVDRLIYMNPDLVIA